MFLNVYKAPHDPGALQPFLNWTTSDRTVASGEFNSVYWAWQPGASRIYTQGEEIQRWAEKNNLTCLIEDKPTHRTGNMMGLA